MPPDTHSILALGGCGGMGRYAIRTLLASQISLRVVVADRDSTRLQRYVDQCGDARVSGLVLDVTDRPALLAALTQADLVLAAVGPYYRLGVPILDAAIEAGCHYVDLNDDGEPTLAMLEHHEPARDAGITAIVGMGASPGVTNLLARLAVEELDQTRSLHTVWGIGQGGIWESLTSLQAGEGNGFGAAMDHWLEQLTGTVKVLENGGLVSVRPLRPVTVDLPGSGQFTCHIVGHPEPVTFAQSWPDLEHSLNLMDLPRSVIRWVERAAAKVDAGEWTVQRAAAHLQSMEGSAVGLLNPDGAKLVTGLL